MSNTECSGKALKITTSQLSEKSNHLHILRLSDEVIFF